MFFSRKQLLLMLALLPPAFHLTLPVPAAAGEVLFSLRAPSASSVSVAGSFNRWDPASHRLAGPDGEGRWTITILLPPGRHEYLFVINGADWLPDPLALSADDGMGGRNSVLLVAPE